jgi:hypothetical protein
MPVIEKFDFKPDVIIGNASIPQLLTVAEPIVSDETILAHPNPFNNFISLKLFSGHKATKFILFDILGHEIQNITIKSDQNEIKIDLQNLPFGIYVVTINDELGNSLYTQKLIKK